MSRLGLLKGFESLPDARGHELFVLATAIAEHAEGAELAGRTTGYSHAVKLLERARARDATDAMVSSAPGPRTCWKRGGVDTETSPSLC